MYDIKVEALGLAVCRFNITYDGQNKQKGEFL